MLNYSSEEDEWLNDCGVTFMMDFKFLNETQTVPDKVKYFQRLELIILVIKLTD